MAKYGECAVQAAKLASNCGNPVSAWNQAAASTFNESRSAREKGCPKSTFLGLCENGLVAGVAAGKYTRSVDNKAYAMKALTLLRQNNELADDPRLLWRSVMGNVQKVENSQMEVVIALWRSKQIA
jgi:hypothetical protein